VGLKPRAAGVADSPDPAFAMLQAVCAGLPGVEESWTYGHPNFRAGLPPRPFAGFEQTKGTWILAIRVGPELRDALLAEGDPYRPVPYDRSCEWIGIPASHPIERAHLEALVTGAHATILSPRRPR
jgi:predicted DNA-binding protein (MmcQ/YjbR family)